MSKFKYTAYGTALGETRVIYEGDDLANVSTFAESQFINRGYDKVVVFDFTGRVAIEHLPGGKDSVCEWKRIEAKPRTGEAFGV
jgi:hypothetical protein